jgi:hypothetical protein
MFKFSNPRLLLCVSVCFFLAGGLLFYEAFDTWLVHAVAMKSLTIVRTAIHEADEIDVSTLSHPVGAATKERFRTKSFPEEYAVTSTRRLSSDQTKEFLGILQDHFYDTRGGAMCHDPGYVLRFRRHGRTMLTASLCLACSNLEIESFPFVPTWVMVFDSKSQDMHLPRIKAFLAKVNEG